MIRNWLLVLAVLPCLSWAADHPISTGVSDFDCSSVNPGDTVTIAGGARGPLTIRDCPGVSGNRITVRNNPSDARVVISGSSENPFRCIDCIETDIIADGGYSGMPAGAYCGAVEGDPSQISRDGCGIKVVPTASMVNIFYITGWSRGMTVRGVWVDGQGTGTPLQVNAHNKCQTGCSTTSNTSCWKEDFIFGCSGSRYSEPGARQCHRNPKTSSARCRPLLPASSQIRCARR